MGAMIGCTQHSFSYWEGKGLCPPCRPYALICKDAASNLKVIKTEAAEKTASIAMRFHCTLSNIQSIFPQFNRIAGLLTINVPNLYF